MNERTTVVALLAAVAFVQPTYPQLWDARDIFIPRPSEVPPPIVSDRFGEALASCDVNEDGLDDLIVGSPDYGGGSGAVSILRADPAGGFRSAVTTVGEEGEKLGAAVVCGHFHGDSTWQFAVGAPGYERDDIREGRVRLFDWASFDALVGDGELRQSLAGVAGSPENGDEYGAALAVGDWNGDGVDDLAVGAPGEAVGALADAGAVTFFYGQSPDGLAIEGNQLWHKNVPGVTGSPAEGERLGQALAAFDADCDVYADLAVGVPSQVVAGVPEAGTVYQLAGSATGLAVEEIDIVDVLDAGGDSPTAGDHFGAALARIDGYFDGTQCGGLAIGAPDRPYGATEYAGHVFLQRPLSGGWHSFRRDDVGTTGVAGADDHFGNAFAAGDWNGDGQTDLAIGVRGNDPQLSNLTGGFYVLLSANGQASLSDARLVQPRSTLEMSNHLLDDGSLGASLARGDFDGDGLDDLAAGTPSGDDNESLDAGGVQVLFSALFAADFEGGNVMEWSDSAP